ncbi:MAG: beta-ketoacyl-ACP synthase I [Cellvibrionales bacterium]|nr:beta-ketoacyl-ACP synthase I [Cellvibrionales bacterium]
MAKRVVVTGMGIISCLGNNVDAVAAALRAGQSGISFCDAHAEVGMRSHVAGQPDIDLAEHIDRKQWRFMGDAAGYAYLSMQQAIEDSGLTDEQVSNPRTGIVAGSGGASSASQVDAADTLRERGLRRVGPYRVTQTMGSTVSACLATPFKIKGVNYSISSACSTSAHCIGNGAELIQLGKQDVVFAGGGEELHWSMSSLFDAMGALSTKYNEQPAQASRAYDADRDGFVIAGGGGMLVLESLDHAKVEGQVDYINAHGTSTPAGDIQELKAVREVFGEGGDTPWVGSTKSLSGHSLGAAGVQEAIYSLLMMRDDFIAASANIDNLDPGAEGVRIVQSLVEKPGLNQVMSNSFGFGGTNATLIFKRFND